MRGTHRGEFMGIPATNREIVVTGIDIVRFDSGKAVEHWHEWSGSSSNLACSSAQGARSEIEM
jgi:hypothetical protein